MLKPHIGLMPCGRWGVWPHIVARKQRRFPRARGPHMQSAMQLAALVCAESCESAASPRALDDDKKGGA